MIYKSDKIMRRSAKVWSDNRYKEKTIEEFRRETWWLVWIIPLYIRDTVIRTQH